MQKNKNRIVLMLVITLMFNFLPTLSVKASDDMKIISSTSITVEQAKAWAKEKGATSTFISLADLYWKYASSNGGVNPGVAYVQAAKETGYGKFGGVIDESYHNPCGLKTKEGSSDTDPNAHQRFNNWDEGVQAHLDHLALYAGASGYPRSNTYDPRHFSFVLGKAPTVVALGGNWAPSSTYGSEVLSMYRQLESTIPKLSPLIELDAPLYGTNVSGSSLEVKGWALNQSGVKAINIYVDSKLIKSTTTGISRTDVKNVYPSYNDAKSGYSTSIDLSSVAAGKRTLTVEQVGNDGSKKSIDTIINVSKLPPLIELDAPSYGTNVSGSVEVKGWALNPSGVKAINIYVDSKLIKSTTTGISRTDVKNVYPSYNDAKSGYSTSIDLSSVAAGKRTLTVEQVGNDGSKKSIDTIINVSKLPPLIELDAPSYGTNVSGSVEVKGWALNPSGVKAINIYVDSKLIKSTTTGISRTDVKNVYPSYNDAKSGYSTSIDLSSVAAGKRTLTVEQVGNDGSKKSIDTIINVSKLASVSAIDTPASSSTITSNKVTVSGWAVSASGVKEIKVYVDGKEKGTTKVGISRTDIGNIYSAYPNASKSGFSVNIDINDIAPGNKTFEIKETSNDGSVHSTYVKANIVKKSPITVIDTPTDNYLEKNDTIKVTGWALNASGISNINVYVDGNKKASVKPTISRQDVINVYPGYQTNNVCGYTTSVSLAGLVAGSHKILVEAVGVDGTINTVSKNIYYKENPSKLIVLDPGHNHGGDDGAYSTHNGVRYSERDINMDIAMKTKAALEAKGYRVVLTRTPFDIEYLSVNDSLTKRVELANSLNADLFISIHQNSFDKESANGTEVYYTTKSNDSGFPASPNKAYKLSTSKTLANNIVNNISSIGFTNRGAKDGNLFVVRNTIMPAVLVECGFISNLKDVTNLTNSNIQEKIATAIANGVYGNF